MSNMDNPSVLKDGQAVGDGFSFLQVVAQNDHGSVRSTETSYYVLQCLYSEVSRVSVKGSQVHNNNFFV